MQERRFAPIGRVGIKSWDELEDKPSAFPPLAHTHPWSDLTGVPAFATRWPTWTEVTDKPSTFAPSAHTHNASDINAGTLSDARLSSNVARRDASNTFTSVQQITATSPRIYWTLTNGEVDAKIFEIRAFKDGIDRSVVRMMSRTDADGNGSSFLDARRTGTDWEVLSLAADSIALTATNITLNGAVTGTSFSGNGASLTALNASNLGSGTVPSARVSGSYTGITGTGALNAGSITSGFGNINIGSSTFTGNGSGLTSLNASNISSGTLSDSRLPGTMSGKTFTGDITIDKTGTTQTSIRRLRLESVGYAVIDVSGDDDNSSGEPGGAVIRLGVDGSLNNLRLHAVNRAEEDGLGNSFPGTVQNSGLIENGSGGNLHLGTGGQVRATINNSGIDVIGTGRIAFDQQTGIKLMLYPSTYYIGIESGTLYYTSNTRMRWYLGGSNGDSNASSAMYLDSNGLTVNAGGTFSGTFVNGINAGGTSRMGSLEVLGTFTNPSDSRLKDAFGAEPEVLSRVRAVPVRRAKFKDEPSTRVRAMFFAEELGAVFPQLVHEADDESRTLMWHPLEAIPILWAAIQELDHKIAQLNGTSPTDSPERTVP